MNITIGVKNNNIAINFDNNVKKERNNKGKYLIEFPDEFIINIGDFYEQAIGLGKIINNNINKKKM